jgi:protocatechuate 3,4-dioxygenase beta subunit
MIKMTEQRAKTEAIGDGQATSTRTDPYEPWEEITRNEPALSSIDEPLTLSEVTSPGPALGAVRPEDSDLTTNAGTGQEAMGQRIIITGRVVDEQGNPVPGVLIEIWQANAAGRYTHDLDSWNAPLDPNFLGKGSCLSDEQGIYRFLTIRPGAYPWKVETNEWRPAHIHLSLMGPSLTSRLVTQLYFPDDPLFPLDSIFQALPEEERPRVICEYDHNLTERDWAMGYRFDIVLRGAYATPFEEDHNHEGGH